MPLTVKGQKILVTNDGNTQEFGANVLIGDDQIEKAVDGYFEDHPEYNVENKQDKLKQGENITISEDGTISAASYDDSDVKEDLRELETNKANASDVYSTTEADAKFLTEHQDVSMFITKAVSDLANYYTKSNTYTKEEVNGLVSAIPKFNILPVDSLPTSNISTSTIYLLKTSETETGNLYTEYIRVGDKWEKLGTQTLDLSGYALKSDIPSVPAWALEVTPPKNVKIITVTSPSGVNASDASYDEIVSWMNDGLNVAVKYNNALYAPVGIYHNPIDGIYFSRFSPVEDNGLGSWGIEYILITKMNGLTIVGNGTCKLIESIAGSSLNIPTETAVYKALQNKIDKSVLLDAGIKDITWSTVRSEITVTTVEDPYKSQRPSGTNLRYWVEFEGCPYFKNRQLYRVTFDGVVYDNLVCDYGILVDNGTSNDVGGSWQLIGNKYLFDSRYESTGEPFCILYVEHAGMVSNGEYYYSNTVGHGILLSESANPHTIKIERANITQKDFPKSLFNNFGYGDRTYQNIANSTYPRTSLGQGNIVGRGSFAIGYSNISTGQYAVAFGEENITSGVASATIGSKNHASDNHAVAIGWNAKASGYTSIAIGRGVEATQETAIAIGGEYAVTQPDGSIISYPSKSKAGASIAIGVGAETNNVYSTAIGFGTKTTGNFQTVLGSFNKEDSSKCLIIGNTRSPKLARSNAHTLDWDGNAWYAGKVESASGILKLGNTEVNETQLKALLALSN